MRSRVTAGLVPDHTRPSLGVVDSV